MRNSECNGEMLPVETRILEVLESGEELLWSGAPDPEVIATRREKWGHTGFKLSRLLRAVLGEKPSGQSGSVPSLAYALTDRRLLILEGGRISREIGPEGFGDPRVKDHGDEFPDVELRLLSGSPRIVLFQALSDAKELRERILEWRLEHQRRAERELEDFVAADPSARNGTPVRNEEYGVTITLPDVWNIEVRQRKKPFGGTFLDVERWKTLEETQAWNVLRARGKFDSSIEIHMDLIEKPVIDYEGLKGSASGRALAGQVVATDRHLRVGRFEGFSVTRKEEVQSSGHVRHMDRSVLDELVILHDGGLQIAVIMKWPEESELVRSAVQRVLKSIRAD